MFATGVLLLAAGHKSGMLLELHKVSFIVFGVLFAVHFLSYVPRVVRSLAGAWRATDHLPGGGLRSALVTAAAGGGVALAMSLLPAIDAWRP